ncbi:unnamed protein product [Medioppia subpectinata]|uniref:Cytochrome P450 n=1 Tax=Medioppia subpectinata TaxID=1979941 RepID=A0A7R9KJ08_9ACAR|nr:unnamed protein product [Medioppia subpectinata]CAG2103061.1 unnamed protein product [Medioppia subpectinata]
MYLLSKYKDNPWMGFNEIRRKHGDVVGLQLGQQKAVLVSSAEVMREVLLLKGDIFCDRPAFHRYALIFGRDRHNSLALCDWSEVQKVRRSMAQSGVIPKYGSKGYRNLSKCIESEIKLMIEETIGTKKMFVLAKQDVLILCANIFMKYLCSKKPPNGCTKFLDSVQKYDYIFHDINQCYAIDFIPNLSVFGLHKSYFDSVEESAISLRDYVEKEAVGNRLEATVARLETDGKDEYEDFLELMLEHYVRNPSSMSWTVCMYEIGDLIGGQSAVGNLLMRLIGFVAMNPSVQKELYIEAKNALKTRPSDDDIITLDHRPVMPLTEASILETLRHTSSPIVPHVNRVDTKLQEYDISKGTMVLFNTYYLNMSPEFWCEPQRFNPSRFISSSGSVSHISKPDHFFPFSSGRRACLGYKMVQTIAFTAIANLVLNYDISALNDEQLYEMGRQLAPKGCLALDLSDKCFKVSLSPRSEK